jgi:hypothetical protein
MKIIRFQCINGVPVPASIEDEKMWSEFKPNQITTHKVTGSKKERSYLQLCMLLACIATVAENSEHPNWDTPKKAKFSLKVALHYVNEDVAIVDKKGRVIFQYRSFGYEGLDHMEACNLFDRAWPILASVIGVSVDVLLAESRKREEERKQKFLEKQRMSKKPTGRQPC